MWLQRFWLQVRAEAGLEDVRLHDLRHSYASMALLSGESVRTLGRLLGHEKPATTLKYAHLSDISVRAAVDSPRPDPLRGKDVNRKRGMRLTDAGIAGLKPDKTEFTVWDRRVAGLGVRVRPSGNCSFVWHGHANGAADQADHRLCRAHDRRRRPARMPGASER